MRGIDSEQDRRFDCEDPETKEGRSAQTFNYYGFWDHHVECLFILFDVPFQVEFLDQKEHKGCKFVL